MFGLCVCVPRLLSTKSLTQTYLQANRMQNVVKTEHNCEKELKNCCFIPLHLALNLSIRPTSLQAVEWARKVHSMDT